MNRRPHPIDLEPWGLCSCLRCRAVVRAHETGPLMPIRADLRVHLYRAWPDLIRNLFTPIETKPGEHRC